MHEIDPQPEPRLTEALRRLAASSPQSAPPQIADGLLNEFRRHHARRRWTRRAGVLGLAACLALAAALVSTRNSRQKQPEAARQVIPVKQPVPVKQPEPAAKAPIHEAAAAPASAPIAPKVHRPAVKQAAAKPGRVRPSAPTATRAFLALPGYDPGVPMDQLNIVRVMLPESALWKMGAPVRPDAGTRRVTADFVVSQDGTPYAVRLVQ